MGKYFSKKIARALILIFSITLILASCNSEKDPSLKTSIKCITTQVFSDGNITATSSKTDSSVSDEKSSADSSGESSKESSTEKSEVESPKEENSKEENDEDSSSQEVLKNILTEFKAIYPNVNLVIDVVAKEDLYPSVINSLKGDEPVDIIIGTPIELKMLAEEIKLADLKDLMAIAVDSEDTEEKVYESIEKLRKLSNDDVENFYPIAVSANLMAFNKNILTDAGMLDKLPKSDTRTWTFEEYTAFMKELSEKLPSNIDTGIFFYGTNEGISGSKRLISNAYEAKFNTGEKIEINSENGLKGIQAVKSLIDETLIVNGFTVDVNENMDKFFKGEIAHSIYYNLGIDLNYKNLKKDNFEVVFMPYPSSGAPKLDYEVIGGSVINSSDEDKIKASCEFLKFIGNNPNITSYAAGNMGMYSIFEKYNDFLKDEYEYLKNTLPMLDDYAFEENFVIDSNWILALRKIMFLNEDETEVINNFAENADEKDPDETGD